MFRYRLQQFMYGRYGNDRFNFALVILSLVLSFVLLFFGRVNIFIRLIFSLPLYYAVFRMFSKNVVRRRAENAWFEGLFYKLKRKKDNIGSKVHDRKSYKYFTCPSCKAKLRVPKGKGKITVTCPKCRLSFKAKS